LLPPTRTLAVAEFAQPSEARAAFRHLAYSKFKHLPLYLEWAPVGIFDPNVTKKAIDQDGMDVSHKSAAEPPTQPEEAAVVVGDQVSIFVKNLSFNSVDSDLRRVFEAIGPLASVTIATKQDPRKPGQKVCNYCLNTSLFISFFQLSMGYGFVEFVRANDAHTALKTLQGCELDGHQLQLKISHRGGGAAASANTGGSGHVIVEKGETGKRKAGDAPEAAKKKDENTKLVVRNVPFEATVRELRELFK